MIVAEIDDNLCEKLIVHKDKSPMIICNLAFGQEFAGLLWQLHVKCATYLQIKSNYNLRLLLFEIGYLIGKYQATFKALEIKENSIAEVIANVSCDNDIYHLIDTIMYECHWIAVDYILYELNPKGDAQTFTWEERVLDAINTIFVSAERVYEYYLN